MTVKSFAHTPREGTKIWHFLDQHLHAVPKIAKLLADKFGAGELAYYAGLWHDLGKYDPKFQEYLELCHIASKTGKSAPRSKTPHAIQGARLAWEKCKHLAPIIYGHHSGLPRIADMKE
ncbi:MAG: CRISPR-associated endonuclease Cas3'' [Pseudanabaenaceae cyanobacterium bins.68]|nr:CRISPR-associated endonuclease Cas3'' [Pseudanabaenaceae cyanobacterium bins.68]